MSATSPTGTVLSECFDFHLGVAITSPAPCSFSKSSLGDNGNVYTVVNNRDNTRTQSLTYDTLNRILSAESSGTQWGETFTIDAWSNLTNESGISGKTSHEGLNTSVGINNRLSGFGYDAAGNTISNGSATYVYDAENRLIATAGTSYIYDGEGERVEKCTEGTTPGTCSSGATGTLYWRGTGSETLAETDLAGNEQEEYLFFNGQRIARRDVNSLGATVAVHYYFSDHLGSHGVVENATGTACEQDIDYYPYGGQQNDYCSGSGVSQNYKFTSKERDTETNLDYFGARYYASSMGRFMTPDPSPAGIAPADPQSWNLYSYVRNRPTRSVDVGGYWATDVHAQIVTFALQGYVSAGELAALRNEQYVMDKDQSPADQYMHAMMSPGQNAGEVSNAMWCFVAGRIGTAQQGVTASGSFTAEGLAALGDAIHTVQDYTSPTHTSAAGDPLVWRGALHGGLAHWEGEASPMADWSRIGDAVRLTMAAYMQANPAAAAQHGLTEKTFGAEAQKRIEDYVHWFYAGSNFQNNNIQEEAARQCALGNPAACGETGRPNQR